MRGVIRFVKMSGSGNDFVVLGPDEADALGTGLPEFARRVCRRGLSVGADGVVAVRPASAGRVAVLFLNPDGAEAFCGNGSRCAARYALRRGMAREEAILETAVGPVAASVLPGGGVRLELAPPTGGDVIEVEAGGERLRGRRIRAGVPHFVLEAGPVAEAPLDRWGPRLRRHPEFGAEGTNVDVVERRAPGEGALRTWERGVEGETLACGSGAVAAAWALRLSGGPEEWTLLPASGIPLRIRLPGPPDAPLRADLEGDARWILEGEISPEAIEGFPA